MTGGAAVEEDECIEPNDDVAESISADCGPSNVARLSNMKDQSELEWMDDVCKLLDPASKCGRNAYIKEALGPRHSDMCTPIAASGPALNCGDPWAVAFRYKPFP